MVSPYDAIVLAGGTARRLGGVDKAMILVGGQPVLERVLAAVREARTVTVVGPRRPTPTPVTWVREEPPLSGPLAGIAAGLGVGAADLVVVAACDLPHFTAPIVGRLRAAIGDRADAGGAMLVDAGGRRQPLAAVYRRSALTAALAAIGDPRDRPVRLLTGELTLVDVPDPVAAADLDTPDDLATLGAEPDHPDRS